jgi:hypothetical protein
MSTTNEVALVSVPDGMTGGEYFWEVPYVGALSSAGAVYSGGSVSRVGMSDGQHEEYCEDKFRPAGTEDGVLA